jgi:hypothetical protein
MQGIAGIPSAAPNLTVRSHGPATSEWPGPAPPAPVAPPGPRPWANAVQGNAWAKPMLTPGPTLGTQPPAGAAHAPVAAPQVSALPDVRFWPSTAGAPSERPSMQVSAPQAAVFWSFETWHIAHGCGACLDLHALTGVGPQCSESLSSPHFGIIFVPLAASLWVALNQDQANL